MSPDKIELKDGQLIINWDDKSSSSIELNVLRRNCPCAYCNQFREHHSNSMLQVFLEDQLKIAEIKTVGSYALGIEWKDGHNTGIYEYNQLKKLAT